MASPSPHQRSLGITDQQNLGSDVALPGTDLGPDDPIKNFLPIPTQTEEGAAKFEICALTDRGSLVQVDSKGQVTRLGIVSNGYFTPLSSEECVIETMGLIKRGLCKCLKKIKR